MLQKVSFADHCHCCNYASFSSLYKGKYCGSRSHFVLNSPNTIFITFPQWYTNIMFRLVRRRRHISHCRPLLLLVHVQCPFIIQILIVILMLQPIGLRNISYILAYASSIQICHVPYFNLKISILFPKTKAKSFPRLRFSCFHNMIFFTRQCMVSAALSLQPGGSDNYSQLKLD